MSPLRTRPLEQVEQSNICNLTRSVGGQAYVLGTRRRRGDYQGTNQTPGIPDLWIWLPAKDVPFGVQLRAITFWWEVKRLGERRTPDQVMFATQCETSGQPYAWGSLDDYIAFLVEHGRLDRSNLPHYRQHALDRRAAAYPS